MMHLTPVERLAEWCQKNALAWPDNAAERFERYMALILKYQKQTNLTGFSTADALVDGLVIDTLQLLRILTPVGPLVDVGSGAGVPAIPLKILCPEIEMHLIEPRTKRYAFLGLVVRELGLDGVFLHNSRVEQTPLVGIRTAVSKAFVPPAQWLELCRDWASAGAAVAGYFSLADYKALQSLPQKLGYVQKNILIEDTRVWITYEMAKLAVK
ncbi:MAG: 16S rRNA (guanine(527)-N(7))-methyltransferase RsmG [Proteobacteria bacterium]|jgi:16S rRNA (guanine527-N7)-methyltransferase|nr:16S rRNA (guanine(527)-N(7))-methyltransferase RsmG [Pseudomonadota bacterium]